jgi:hypothetical protein
LPQGHTPIFSIAGMMQLIENEQGAPIPAGALEERRRQADLLIRHHRAVVIAGFPKLLVCQRRIQLDAYLSGRRSPLAAQVVCRTHDQQAVRRSIGQVLVGDPQCESGFSRRRGGRGQKIRTLVLEDRGDGPRLPIA